MKRITIHVLYVWLILQGLCNYSHAQTLTQDTKGNSSILFKSNMLGIDINDTRIRYAINGFAGFKGTRSRILYGFLAEGSNSSGLAGLLKGFDVIPGSRFQGSIGYEISKDNSNKDLDERIKKLKDYEIALRNQYCNTCDSLKQIEIEKEIDEIHKKLNQLNELNDQIISYWRFIPFVNFGIESKSFKSFEEIDSINIASSFRNETFQGGFFDFGFNLYHGPWILGITYGFQDYNNLENLTKIKYNYEEKTTNGSQSLTSTKEITAFKGDYQTLGIKNLRIDLAYFLSLPNSTADISDDGIVAPTFYLRYQKSSNKDILISTTDIGLNFSFFKTDGKFMGGFYMQLNDINDNKDDLETVSDSKLKERFMIGLTTKFALTGFSRSSL